VSDKSFHIVCELELQSMVSETGTDTIKFNLKPHEKKLLKLDKEGHGPWSFTFNTKASF